MVLETPTLNDGSLDVFSRISELVAPETPAVPVVNGDCPHSVRWLKEQEISTNHLRYALPLSRPTRRKPCTGRATPGKTIVDFFAIAFVSTSMSCDFIGFTPAQMRIVAQH
jgi:hypothetical protein